MNDAPTETDIKEEAAKVASMIDAARRLTAEDKTVDLSALEGKVRKLCEGFHQQADSGDTECMVLINVIIGELEKLEAELTAKKGQMEEQGGEHHGS